MILLSIKIKMFQSNLRHPTRCVGISPIRRHFSSSSRVKLFFFVNETTHDMKCIVNFDLLSSFERSHGATCTEEADKSDDEVSLINL